MDTLSSSADKSVTPDVLTHRLGTLKNKAKFEIANAMLEGRLPFRKAQEMIGTPGYAPNELERLILAMAFCHVGFSLKLKLYGGFLRDLYAGAEFNDVDMYIPLDIEYTNLRIIEEAIPRMVSLILGEEPMTVTFTQVHESLIPPGMPQHKYQTDVYVYELKLHDITVMVDISIGNNLDKKSHGPYSGYRPQRNYRPAATIGSSLEYDGTTLSYRDPYLSSKYCISRIKSLLFEGKDIKRELTFIEKKSIDVDSMNSYVIPKYAKLEEKGYIFVT